MNVLELKPSNWQQLPLYWVQGVLNVSTFIKLGTIHYVAMIAFWSWGMMECNLAMLEYVRFIKESYQISSRGVSLLEQYPDARRKTM